MLTNHIKEEIVMKIGETIRTPRFCNVTISAIFSSEENAQEDGFCEPTHYNNVDYKILGKHIDTNRMIFAAVKI